LHKLFSGADRSHSDAQAAPLPVSTGRSVTFDFEESVEGVAHPVPSVSPLQQETFTNLFWQEIANLEKWAADQQWSPPSPFPNLRVFVASRYEFARSLIPQWKGEHGRMEFPAFRVAVGEANILHELVHVYFPNSNRMLAEGLAVYLQQVIGENFGYPDFGADLHLMMRRKLKIALGCELDEINLVSLDKITTPTRLMLRIEKRTIKDGWTYIIAASFVRYLIETYKMDRFHNLYMTTPLVASRRDAGRPERWNEIYGLPLTELESQWKSMISSLIP
jgi:hypothetical protein